jgi:hypothetical protein
VPSFNDAPTTDHYQPAGSGLPTIEGILPLPNGGGRFNINSGFGAVLVQVQYGGQGAVEWAENEEQLLNPGAYGTIPEDACGIRFRSAVAGTPGKVSASIGTDPTRPALSIEALGAVAPLVVAARATQQVFTAAVPVGYALPTGCTAILVECIGGGGAGGGSAVTAAGTVAAGGGGGGGAYASKLIPVSFFTAPATLLVSPGVAGAPGGAGAGGGAGDPSIFQESGGAGILVQADGGNGGAASAAAAPPAFGGSGGFGGPLGSIGDVILPGHPGQYGILLGLAQVVGGPGGPGARGGGGARQTNVNGNGFGALGIGGGGGGGIGTAAQPARQGGGGFTGLVVVTEFY